MFAPIFKAKEYDDVRFDIRYICCDWNSKIFASCSKDKIFLWDYETKSLIRKIKTSYEDNVVYRISLHPKKRQLASCSYFSTISIWDTSNGDLIKEFDVDSLTCQDVRFNPSGDFLFACMENEVKMFDTREYVIFATIAVHCEPASMTCFHPKLDIVASCGGDNDILISDSKECWYKSTFEGHSKDVFCVSFSPSGDTRASCSSDGSIILWDFCTGKPKQTLKIEHKQSTIRLYGEEVICVSFHPLGNLLVSLHKDLKIRVWNIRDNSLVRTYSIRNHVACNVFFSQSGKSIIFADREIKEIPVVDNHTEAQVLLLLLCYYLRTGTCFHNQKIPREILKLIIYFLDSCFFESYPRVLEIK